jgi:ubiquitin carboxyl-terminal hydrolase MINDY-3/4
MPGCVRTGHQTSVSTFETMYDHLSRTLVSLSNNVPYGQQRRLISPFCLFFVVADSYTNSIFIIATRSMAPKKEKGDTTALVAAFLQRPYEEQVDLLSQALLREFMHKRHFKETLAMFDEECPRDERTISSRALMTELMLISPDLAARLKAEGIETIMEILCSMRVEKATTVEERWKELHAILETKAPEVPQSYLNELPALEDEIRKTKKRIKKEKKLARQLKEESTSKQTNEAKPVKDGAKKKKNAKNAATAGGMLTIDQLLDQDDSGKIEKINKPQPSKQVGLNNAEKDNELTTPTTASAPKPPSKNPADAPDSESDGSSSSSSSSSDSDDRDEDDYAASLKKIREEEKQALNKRANRKGWNELEEVQESPPRAVDTMMSPGNSNKKSSGSPAGSAHHQNGSANNEDDQHTYEKLGIAVAEQLKVALVGSDRRIPISFWNQGFHFSSDVEYGLLQNEGGSCGVLAVIQALVLADIFGEHRLLSDNVKRNALVKAFSATLTLIEPDVRKITVVHAPSHHHHAVVNTAMSIREQLMFLGNLTKTSDFASVEDLEMFLAADVLKFWTEPKGHGLLCWMLSCLLTRSITLAQRDMDVESPFIVEHGYCSQELVNLMMCGRSTSNVHNGDMTHGELVLKGFPSPLHIGFLSYMEHRKILTVGTYGKSPTFPVWVIHHESHYTALFMKNDKRAEIKQGVDRAFTPSVSFDVFFWDQLGGQDEEIRLTVTLEKNPPPPVGRDVMVPYLNDIVRTVPEWATARVSWNGSDPLL